MLFSDIHESQQLRIPVLYGQNHLTLLKKNKKKPSKNKKNISEYVFLLEPQRLLQKDYKKPSSVLNKPDDIRKSTWLQKHLMIII